MRSRALFEGPDWPEIDADGRPDHRHFDVGERRQLVADLESSRRKPSEIVSGMDASRNAASESERSGFTS
jgi:hypothetical protein